MVKEFEAILKQKRQQALEVVGSSKKQACLSEGDGEEGRLSSANKKQIKMKGKEKAKLKRLSTLSGGV